MVLFQIALMASHLDIDCNSLAHVYPDHHSDSTRTRMNQSEPAAVWGRAIKKSYGKQQVLNNLNITVPRGCM